MILGSKIGCHHFSYRPSKNRDWWCWNYSWTMRGEKLCADSWTMNMSEKMIHTSAKIIWLKAKDMMAIGQWSSRLLIWAKTKNISLADPHLTPFSLRTQGCINLRSILISLLFPFPYGRRIRWFSTLYLAIEYTMVKSRPVYSWVPPPVGEGKNQRV